MAKKQQKQPKKESSFINPIDKDKITETPGLLPYAHTVGGAVIRPEDKGRIRGNAMVAMYDQTDRQLEQLRVQMETLMQQAKSLKERVNISEIIYGASMGFQPVIHHIYYLYQRQTDSSFLLSMVSPSEWGRKMVLNYYAKVRLLGDHTWEVLDHSDLFEP